MSASASRRADRLVRRSGNRAVIWYAHGENCATCSGPARVLCAYGAYLLFRAARAARHAIRVMHKGAAK
jgi:hypothetical protein